MQTTRRPSPAWLGLLVLLGITMGLSQTWAQSFLGDYRFGTFGESRESNRLDREQLISRGNSCPSGGCVLRLDQVAVRPARIGRGQTVVLATTYTILTPEQVAIPVAISRKTKVSTGYASDQKEVQFRVE